jgi:tetratricopeptide (TPR) repeat protein
VDEHNPSSVYTNLVDVWSLGCVIYKVVAKSVPFQNGRDIKRFCDQRIPFPAEPLQGKLTTDGIDFLQSILVPKPLARPTADIALQHSWLVLDEEYAESIPRNEQESPTKEDLSSPLEADTGIQITPVHHPEDQEHLGSRSNETQQPSQELASQRTEEGDSERGRSLEPRRYSPKPRRYPSPERRSPKPRRYPSSERRSPKPRGYVSLERSRSPKPRRYPSLERSRSPTPRRYPALERRILQETPSLEKPRRFSLLPAAFSLKAVGVGMEYSAPPPLLDDEYHDEAEDSNGGYMEPLRNGTRVMGQEQEHERLVEVVRYPKVGENIASSRYAAAGLVSPTKAQKKEGKYLNGQGTSAYGAQNYPLAVDFYTKALMLIPGDPIVLCNRSAAYCSLNDHRNAITDAEAAIAADPQYAISWYLLGHVRYELGDSKGSMEAFQQCIERTSNSGSDEEKNYSEVAKRRVAQLEAEQGEEGTNRSIGGQGVIGTKPIVKESQEPESFRGTPLPEYSRPQPAGERFRRRKPTTAVSVPVPLEQNRTEPATQYKKRSQPPQSTSPYPPGLSEDGEPADERIAGRGVLQKNYRRFADAYGEANPGYDGGIKHGSRGAARKVIDFFRRRDKNRAGEPPIGTSVHHEYHYSNSIRE